MDDLGRIVIPKEIRQLNNWKYEDQFEINVTDDGCVLLRKYYPTGQEGLIQITAQVEGLLARDMVKGSVRDYLAQAFTELKCAIEALTLDAQNKLEVSE